jgi:hypothetical protein
MDERDDTQMAADALGQQLEPHILPENKTYRLRDGRHGSYTEALTEAIAANCAVIERIQERVDKQRAELARIGKKL